MTYKVSHPVIVACLFLWVGFVSAISFMEAWLKFRAPGVTLEIGLGIGRIIFWALNKVEWFFVITIICYSILQKSYYLNIQNCLIAIAFLIVCVQTWWLLPALDKRVMQYVNFNTPQPSNLHYYFVCVEIVKVFCAFLAALFHIKK